MVPHSAGARCGAPRVTASYVSSIITVLSLLAAVTARAQEGPASPPMPADRAAGSPAGQPTDVVRGMVVDERGRPLPGAEVSVPQHPTVRTDEHGVFILALAESRRPVMVAVRQVGFVPDSVRLDRGVDSLRIVLRSVPTTLGAVVVTAKASEQKLIDNGFYRRQRMSYGRHLDAVALRAYVGPGLAGIVHDTPRLSIRRTGTDDYAFSSVGGRPCRMNVFIDGRFERLAMPSATGGEGLGLRGLIPFDFIYAVEVYPSAASVPIQFSRVGANPGVQGRGSSRIPSPVRIYGGGSDENQNAECGALVIWTKEPETSSDRP